MGKLFEKLELLVDEVTGLVREERVRRNKNPFGWPWDITGQAPDFYGPRGTEFRVNSGPDHPAARNGYVPSGTPGGT
ncbi:hypothetical protein [Caudoviricetes sp.]|nr:hypothetical protein [Caudoviricetes sp.]